MNDSQINDVLFRHAFIVAMIIGTLCRFFVLRVKDSQYPTMPQDYIEQIIIATLAASLGAVAFPALIDKEFSALTFLAIGIQQFQGLAQQEKITLENTDADELVGKGEAYIDLIATTYEVRSYISLFSALISSILYIFIARRYDAGGLICTVFAAIGGIIVAFIFRRILRRSSIKDVADIYPAKISFEGPLLKVNNIVMTNIGLEETRKKYLEKGMAIEIVPKDMADFGIINDIGQQRAIMHNIYLHLGIDKDIDEVDIKSIARTDLNRKSIVIVTIPLLKDEVILGQVVESCPILDTAKGKQSAYKKKSLFFE